MDKERSYTYFGTDFRRRELGKIPSVPPLNNSPPPRVIYDGHGSFI